VTFPADALIIGVHPPHDANWRERHFGKKVAQSVFGLPVTELIFDQKDTFSRSRTSSPPEGRGPIPITTPTHALISSRVPFSSPDSRAPSFLLPRGSCATLTHHPDRKLRGGDESTLRRPVDDLTALHPRARRGHNSYNT